MGRLQRRHRWHHVAQQSGRNAKAATGDPTDAGLPAAMVSRRQADRLLWSSARRTVANLFGSGGGRRARTGLSKFHQPGGPELVAGRPIAGVRGKFTEQSGISGVHPRTENAQGFEAAGIRWALFAALVAGWAVHRGNSAGFAETAVIRSRQSQVE